MEIVEILALLYLAGKARGGGKGCAELLWQESRQFDGHLSKLS